MPTQRMIFLVFVCLIAGCVVETTGSVFSDNKDPQKAVAAYVDAGMLHLQQGNIERAKHNLDRAGELDQDNPQLNNALAYMYSIEGEDARVEEYYLKALSQDGGFSQARNNYANYLFGKQRYQEALEQLNLALKDYHYPKRYQVFQNKGLCQLRVGDVQGAEKSFKRALQLNSQLPLSLLELAEIKLHAGDHDLAMSYLEQYKRVGGVSARYLWLGIQIQRIVGDSDVLAGYERTLQDLYPGSPEHQAFKSSYGHQGD